MNKKLSRRAFIGGALVGMPALATALGYGFEGLINALDKLAPDNFDARMAKEEEQAAITNIKKQLRADLAVLSKEGLLKDDVNIEKAVEELAEPLIAEYKQNVERSEQDMLKKIHTVLLIGGVVGGIGFAANLAEDYRLDDMREARKI